tara:strand:- start:113 stop:298 length:186 start_codon:yes stop_codon:yes gene_type:complete
LEEFRRNFGRTLTKKEMKIGSPLRNFLNYRFSTTILHHEAAINEWLYKVPKKSRAVVSRVV